MKKKFASAVAVCLLVTSLSVGCKSDEKSNKRHSSKRSIEQTTENTEKTTTEETTTEQTTTEQTTAEQTTTEASITESTTAAETTTEETTVMITPEVSDHGTEAGIVTEPEIRIIEDFDLEEYIADIKYSGAVLVSEERETVFSDAYGFSEFDLSTGEMKNNTTGTVFEMGSITKQFTAVAIMQLEEKGLLSTEDTLDKYIPEYPYADQITIHQLLNMTSGIVDYITGGPYGYDLYNMKEEDFGSLKEATEMFADVCIKAVVPITPDELVEMVSPYELNFEPGTQFEYSNTNYYFLGMIIEQVSGMSYDDYIRENILNPLELTELWPDLNHIDSSGSFRVWGIDIPVPHQDTSISYSVGVMTGTVEGLLKWEYCVMDRVLLAEESWNKIFDGGEFGYGYGWYITDDFVYHSGMTLGYNAAVVIDRENGNVVIALSNVQSAEFDEQAPSSKELAMTIIGNI